MKKKDLKILKIVFIISTVVMVGSILFYFCYRPNTALDNVGVSNTNSPVNNGSGGSLSFNPVSDSAKGLFSKYGWNWDISSRADNGNGYNLVLSNKGLDNAKISLLVSKSDGEFNVRNFSQSDKYAFYGKTIINLETGKTTDIQTSYGYCDGKMFKWTPDNMLLMYGPSSSNVGSTFACVIRPEEQEIAHYVGFDLPWGEDVLPIGDVAYYDNNFYIYKISKDNMKTGACLIYKASSKPADGMIREKLKPSLYKMVSDSVRTSVGANYYCKSTMLDINGTSFKLGRDFIPD